MALLINKKYIKINIDGSYIIYKNKTARAQHKKATNSQVIYNKYIEILNKLHSKERAYYDAENLLNELDAWANEMSLYITDLENFNSTNDYPLMSQYIPDIKLSIPKAIESGKLGLAAQVNTLSELYTLVKKYKIFGECEDA